MKSALNYVLVAFWIIFVQSFALAQDDYLHKTLPHFKSTIDKSTSPPCLQCFDEGSTVEKTKVLQSKKFAHPIDVSLITLDRAREVFKELAASEDIPHEFLLEGCFARTHAMNQMMDEMGLISVKAAVEGELHVKAGMFGDVRWGYHVAPMVMVKTPKGNVPYVFDPSLFKEPVPFEEWKKYLLKNPKSKYTGEYFASRFNLHPDNRYSKRTSYDEEDHQIARAHNRDYARMLDMLKMDPKKVKQVMKDIKNER